MEEKESKIIKSIIEMCVIKCIRPDFLNYKFNELLEVIMSSEFVQVPELDLSVTLEDTESKTPIILCCAPGFDAAYKVDNLSREKNVKLISIALGSNEADAAAEKAINDGMVSGFWVLLKNIHLKTDWLSFVERQVFRSNAHENFRLFMTMEFSEKIPNTLLKASYKYIFELPDGVKPSITRVYNTALQEKRSDKPPLERAR